VLAYFFLSLQKASSSFHAIMITSIILQGLHTYLPSKLSMYAAGLPDGLFSHQKSQYWLNLEGIGIENVAILYDHLV
jgi:hypothetical protein